MGPGLSAPAKGGRHEHCVVARGQNTASTGLQGFASFAAPLML